jgi:hypothetical protein
MVSRGWKSGRGRKATAFSLIGGQDARRGSGGRLSVTTATGPSVLYTIVS